MTSLRTSVLIVGGGVGGMGAALALGGRGVGCVVVEGTDWVGGQLTSQAVPPDENRWIEGEEGVQGATRSYLEYRRLVREWYRVNRKLTAAARANPRLNPGGGWVSHLCHEPAVGYEVLRGMLAPLKSVRVMLESRVVGVEVAGDRVRAVRVVGREGEFLIEAAYVLDASEMGDVLAMGGIEHMVGGEHRGVFGELHGREDRSEARDVQAVSWCFALEHRPGEDHTVGRPERYGFWREWVPPLEPAWPGPLFSWVQVGGAEHKAREFRWVPWPEREAEGEWEMWRYRRIVDGSIYADGGPVAGGGDVALINMVQMDYFLKPTLGVSEAELAAAFAEAKEQALCFLYWMQTEAPRFDGKGTGYTGLKLRGDELGTKDGFAKTPYIREARRLEAMRVVSERDVGMEQRRAEGLVRPEDPAWGIGECFRDSVGIGHYRLDLHPSAAMRHSVYVEAAPFRIPLGALVPKRVRNVIAAGKCLGVTHVTNGCYRLHPVEWNVGESAGHLAAYCLAKGVEPRAVAESESRVRELQGELMRAGVAISWPWEKGAGLG